MLLRRLAALGIALAALFSLTPCQTHAVSTSASSAILMDVDSGRVLYEQNADAKMLIASTTKILTALVAIREGDLSDMVTVSREAAYTEGSSMYLKVGEQLTLETLLYGLLLCSGNDAAVAIAEHISGSQERFADLMNETARDIGMEHSSFANPNGLDDEDHYSTARDMARLACAAVENETLVRMASTRSVTIGGRTMTNHNKLLSQIEGCIGLKTGYTDEAGRCLVSAAERDGAVIISVVLHDPEDWDDSAALLDWGFSALTPVALETDLSEVQVHVRSETETALFYTVRPRESLSAALAPGERLSPVLSVRESLPETARTGDTAGMLRWVDAEGKTRCWTALELDALTSPDAAAPPGQSTIP